jgi:hypothetical protein
MNKSGRNGNKCSQRQGKRWVKITDNHLKEPLLSEINEEFLIDFL